MLERKQLFLVSGLLVLTLGAGGAAIAAASAFNRAPTMRSVGFDPVGLRTSKTPPAFSLTDQQGAEVTLEALRGRVVILTAVYATCHTACPTIITQAKAAVTKLSSSDRADVAIVAITLDPEGDTQEKRAAAARTHGLDAPLFNYVNGEDPVAVLKLVEDLGWARAVVGDTGEIGHSNMFLLVDRAGQIAYTISADTETDWLDQGLRVLLDER